MTGTAPVGLHSRSSPHFSFAPQQIKVAQASPAQATLLTPRPTRANHMTGGWVRYAHRPAMQGVRKAKRLWILRHYTIYVKPQPRPDRQGCPMAGPDKKGQRSPAGPRTRSTSHYAASALTSVAGAASSGRPKSAAASPAA